MTQGTWFPGIFISCVTREFADLRQRLRDSLMRAECHPIAQEDFAQVEFDTLLKLDRLVRRSEAVIHVIGDRSGAVPSARDLGDYLQEVDRDGALLSHEPRLRAAVHAALAGLSYTQWEALMAVHHKKPLWVYRAVNSGSGAADAGVDAHAARLIELGRHSQPFRDAADFFRIMLGDLPRVLERIGRGRQEEWSRIHDLPPAIVRRDLTFVLVPTGSSYCYLSSHVVSPAQQARLAGGASRPVRFEDIEESWLEAVNATRPRMRLPTHAEWMQADKLKLIDASSGRPELCVRAEQLLKVTGSKLPLGNTSVSIGNLRASLGDCGWRLVLIDDHGVLTRDP